MTKNIFSRVISRRTVFNYFANFSSLLKIVPIALTYSVGRLRAALTPLIGPGQRPGEGLG